MMQINKYKYRKANIFTEEQLYLQKNNYTDRRTSTRWKDHMQQCIASDGNYVEGDNTII
jgi:hypothetical protein